MVQFSQKEFIAGENADSATITVQRLDGGVGHLVVEYATVNESGTGIATPGSDYGNTRGQLEWQEGQTEPQSFQVPILDDSEPEGDESLKLVIVADSSALSPVPSGSTGVMTVDDQATLIIQDDDKPTVPSQPSELRLSPANVAVDENQGEITFTVERTGGSVGDVSVSFVANDGSAYAGSDYDAVQGNLSWAEGDSSRKSITVYIMDDQEDEMDEEFSLSLTGATGASISQGSASVVIHDNDEKGQAKFAEEQFSVKETDKQAIISLYRYGGTAGTLTVNYATGTDGSATEGRDYEKTQGTLQWQIGDIQLKTFTIPIQADSETEGDESVQLTLTDATGQVTQTTMLIITEVPPVAEGGVNGVGGEHGEPRFTASNFMAKEDAGNATLSVRREGSVVGELAIRYVTSDGTAKAGRDYDATEGTLQWSAGESQEKTFKVPIFSDQEAEPDETVTVNLLDSSGQVINSTTLTITSPAPTGQPRFTLPNFTVTEAPNKVATIMVRREDGLAGKLSVKYRTSNRTALANSDYEAREGILVWENEETQVKSFEVPILNDTTPENEENLLLELLTPENQVLETATLTIVDDDTATGTGGTPVGGDNSQVRFTDEFYTVHEADTEARITVHRDSGTLPLVLTVRTTGGGTASEGADYTAKIDLVQWGGSETGEKVFMVNVQPDTVYPEEDETVKLELVGNNQQVIDTATLILKDSSRPALAEQTLMGVAQNPTQGEIGRVLGKICDVRHASTRLLERCDELVKNAQPRPGEVANALQEIAPEEIAAHAHLAAQNTAVQFKNVDARLGTLRKGERKSLNLSGLTVNLKIDGQVLPSYLFASLLALNEADTETDATATQAKTIDSGFSRLGVFVNGNVNVGEKDRTNRETGFEFTTYGLTAGADYRFTDRLVAGIAFGYSDNSSDLDGAGGNMDTKGYGVTLYGTAYQSDDIYVEGLYSFGRNNFSTQRNIFYGVAATRINQAALSSNNSDQQALGIGAGYHLVQQALTMTPNVRLDYVQTDIDGFRETFSQGNLPGTELGLEINAQSVKSMTLTLGLQTNYVISQSWGVLIPHANLEMVHEFQNESRSLTGRFLEDWDKNTFVLNTDEPDRDYFNLALGFSAQFAQGRSAFFQYQGTLGMKDYSSHGVTAGVRVEF